VDGKWGSVKPLEGKPWPGTVGEVARGEADIILSMFKLTQERREVIEPSYSYGTTQ